MQFLHIWLTIISSLTNKNGNTQRPYGLATPAPASRGFLEKIFFSVSSFRFQRSWHWVWLSQEGFHLSLSSCFSGAPLAVLPFVVPRELRSPSFLEFHEAPYLQRGNKRVAVCCGRTECQNLNIQGEDLEIRYAFDCSGDIRFQDY